MLLKIKAYKPNDDLDGESIVFSIDQRVIVCCAADINAIIEKLSEARTYALRAEVGDEPLEIILTL